MIALRHTLAAALVAAIAIAPTLAWSEDAGLYAAPPPPDAAFVRILNADATADASLAVAGTTLVAGAAALSPYSFVTKGDYNATIPGGTLAVSFAAQKYYTVLLGPDGKSTVVEDTPVANPVHAGLYFYNLTPAPLALEAKVGATEAAVFKDVAPGQTASREVNAFDVAFTVAGSGDPVALPPISLVRQQGVSIVALQDGGKLVAFQVVNSVSATN